MYDYNYDYAYDAYNAADTTGVAAALAGVSLVTSIISIAVSLLIIISMWKIFTKNGKPGWAAIIPIYNIIVMLQIAELPTWYLVLFLVPFANIYVLIKIYAGLAKKEGKSTGFVVGMVFLPVIFFPILAFGKSNVVVEEQQPVYNQQPVQPIEQPTMPQQPIYNQQPVTSAPVMQEPVTPTPNPVQEQPVMPQQPEVVPTQEPVMTTPIMEQPVMPTPEPAPVQQPVVNGTFPSMSNVVEKPAAESTITQGMPEPPVNPAPVVEPVQVTPDSVLAENANIQNVQNTDFLNNQNNNNGQL